MGGEVLCYEHVLAAAASLYFLLSHRVGRSWYSLHVTPSPVHKSALSKKMDGTTSTTEYRGVVYRRVPTPVQLSPRTKGRHYREFINRVHEREDKARRLEEEQWKRTENSAREADPDWRRRVQEDRQRQSALYKSAVEAIAAQKTVASLLKIETRRQSSQVRKIARSSLQPAVRRSGSPSQAERHPPLGRYNEVIVTPVLEKERSSKPYAVAHAQQELLSIGVIEAKVAELFAGNISVESVVDLCERASVQQAESLAPSALARALDTSVVSYDSALAREARALLDSCKEVPIGNEMLRISKAMKRGSDNDGAAAFSIYQDAKRAAVGELDMLIQRERVQLAAAVQQLLASSSASIVH